ncbi:hypothetical protein KAJ87_00305 [Candidatus Pacearchaeota archaeon]|nr:hypothetical protein [Candidatus Pacearchaeota archaeon]
MKIKNGSCVMEAWKLKEKDNDEGSVYYVYKIDQKSINHAYYLPYSLQNEKNLDKTALNQKENGYPHYPPLTVREVLKYGRKFF